MAARTVIPSMMRRSGLAGVEAGWAFIGLSGGGGGEGPGVKADLSLGTNLF